MGFFTKNTTPQASAAAVLPPLSKDRVMQALDHAEWKYQIDDDGDIFAVWDMGHFYFFVGGQRDDLLWVRGYWRARLEEADHLKAVKLCNDWNRSKIWPKTYALAADAGFVHVSLEHNVDYAHGATDAQIFQHIICAVNTGLEFFESLNEAFPEAWEKHKPAAE